MKTHPSLLVLCGLLALFAVRAGAESAVSMGARYHTEHSVFTELPFEDGDMSYSLGYEYHDASGYWQIMVGYAPGAGSGTNSVDSVITPQINLLLSDRSWIGGVGALASYIEGPDESDWTDVYWQVMFGLEIPIGSLKLEILTYYPFEEWGGFSDFEMDDLEFGASLKYFF
ncbi:MAG: hypothetical protein HN341_12530 [Verrucomicrobia bacterium]|nr:hypothetical protein [Verrucomicrobiota bacterium]